MKTIYFTKALETEGGTDGQSLLIRCEAELGERISPHRASISILNYEMALRDFGSMGKEREVP